MKQPFETQHNHEAETAWTYPQKTGVKSEHQVLRMAKRNDLAVVYQVWDSAHAEAVRWRVAFGA